jgi:hypothetical protein
MPFLRTLSNGELLPSRAFCGQHDTQFDGAAVLCAFIKQETCSTGYPPSSRLETTNTRMPNSWHLAVLVYGAYRTRRGRDCCRHRVGCRPSWPVANSHRDLFEAMKQVADTGHRPKEQFPSMGCSIKWKPETRRQD